jgi:hypothetical protein
MNSAILALLIATSPAELPEETRQKAICEIVESSQTGSLLFSQGDCLAVKAYTNSPYTHVATIIYDDHGTPIVYDSMNGPGVRKMTLKDYIAEQAPDEVQLFHPKRPFTKKEGACYRDHLESQLGRPYAVQHHITGKRAKGIHCSEYVTDALVEIDWLKVNRASRVSPASLVEGITTHAIYSTGRTIELPVIIEPIPEPVGRCARLWLETKTCTVACCEKMSGWIFCR